MKMRRIIGIILAFAVAFITLIPASNHSVEAASSSLNRVYGANRYETSIKAAKELKRTLGSKLDAVVLASGMNYPDALSGSYLASSAKGALILIDDKNCDKVISCIKQVMKRNGKIYILGGAAAVSEEVENKLSEAGYKLIERLGGADRYETNLEILKTADELYEQNNNGARNEYIMICSGAGYADALAAGATGNPILVVGRDITEEQKEYLLSRGKNIYYVIGGTGAVSPLIEEWVKSVGSTKRLSGESRYETAIAVAKKFYPSKVDDVVVVSGTDYPDGLSACTIAQAKNCPIIMASNSHLAQAYNYQVSREVKNAVVLGGPSLVSDTMVAVEGAGLKAGWNEIGDNYVYIGKKGTIVTTSFKEGTVTITPSAGGIVLSSQRVPFIWPAEGILTSYFGPRYDVPYWASSNHGGIDVAVYTGTPIKATRSGTVIAPTGWYMGYGYAVIIQHDSGYVSLYGHLSKILVKKGQRVEQGEIIARSGSTGNSTGPHLHFEIRINDVKVDPLKYLPGNSYYKKRG